MARFTDVFALALLCNYISQGEGGSHNATSNSNLCTRQLQFSQRQINIEGVLRGLTINVASGLWDDLFLRQEGAGYAGFEKSLLDALSERAGFNYNLLMRPPSEGVSWGNWLFELMDNYDVVTYGYWQETQARANRGALTPRGFIDASYRMVALSTDGDEETTWERITKCFFPLKAEVWLVALAALVVTGFIYLIVERQNADEFPDGVHPASVVESVFKPCLRVTGGGGYGPKSWPGKLILASWSWFVVLFLAAYTANFASYLTVQNIPRPQYTSLADAMQKGAQICLERGQLANWFQQRYPNYVSKVTYFDEVGGDGLATARHLGHGCDAIIVLKFIWDQKIRNSRTLNKDCRMTLIGDSLQPIYGGWMVATDTHNRCTSILREALNHWFLNMWADGSLQNLLADLTGGGATCVPEDRATDNARLELEEMSGPFYIHGIILVISLALYVALLGSRKGGRVASQRTNVSGFSSASSYTPESPKTPTSDTPAPVYMQPMASLASQQGLAIEDREMLQSIQSRLGQVENKLSDDISELSRKMTGLTETMSECIKYVNLKVRV